MLTARSATLPPSGTAAEPFAQPAAGRGSFGAAAALASTVVLTLLAYIGFQRSGFDEVLGLTRLELTGEEPWLVPATVLATSLTLLLPAVAASSVLAWLGFPRAARYVFIGLSSAVIFLLGLDFAILRSFGRHLTEIVQVPCSRTGTLLAESSGAGAGCSHNGRSWPSLPAVARLLSVSGSSGRRCRA